MVPGCHAWIRRDASQACRILGEPRGMQRFVPAVLINQDALTRASMAPAFEFGRHGERRISALWQAAGWAGSGQVGHHAG